MAAEGIWHPVKEIMPTEGITVLFASQFGVVCVGYWRDGQWHDEAWDERVREGVTHWMPLPSAPKQAIGGTVYE